MTVKRPFFISRSSFNASLKLLPKYIFNFFFKWTRMSRQFGLFLYPLRPPGNEWVSWTWWIWQVANGLRRPVQQEKDWRKGATSTSKSRRHVRRWNRDSASRGNTNLRGVFVQSRCPGLYFNAMCEPRLKKLTWFNKSSSIRMSYRTFWQTCKLTAKCQLRLQFSLIQKSLKLIFQAFF